MRRWIELPQRLLAGGPAEPYLVQSERLSDLRGFAIDHGATWVDLAMAGVLDSGGAIRELKTVLPFPEWCASSWDSVADAFEEIRGSWTFPLVIAVHGLRHALETHSHVGLEVVIRLSELARAMSVEGDQLIVFYVDSGWT